MVEETWLQTLLGNSADKLRHSRSDAGKITQSEWHHMSTQTF